MHQKCAAILPGHERCPTFLAFLQLSGWSDPRYGGYPASVEPPAIPGEEAWAGRCIGPRGVAYDEFAWTFDGVWDPGGTSSGMVAWASTVTVIFHALSGEVVSIVASTDGVNVPAAARFCCNPDGENVSEVAWGPYPGDTIDCIGPGTFTYDWREL